MGLPNRFIHGYWGGTSTELVTEQNKEVFSILELALNTVPSHAFLRSRNMRNEVARHARLIRSYARQHGRDRIEKLRAAQSAMLKQVKGVDDLRNAAESPYATKPKFEKNVEANEDRDSW